MGNGIIIILFGLICLPWCLALRYFYQTQLLTWDKAQQNCREHYTDLATFESQKDIDGLLRPAGLVTLAWIGLREDPSTWKHMGNASTSWRWSATGQTSQSGFSNWMIFEPNNFGGESCVIINWAGLWLDFSCAQTRPFVCFNGSAENATYVYISTHTTWGDAREYCRQHHVDLVTIENAEDNKDVKSLLPWLTDAWIGLYRIPFAWSDHNPSTFRNWAELVPDNAFGVQYCGAETLDHVWDDRDCSWKLPSICYKPDWKTRKTVLRCTLSSAIDLRTPGVLQQIQQQLTDIVGQNQTEVRIQLKIVSLEPET